MYYSFVNNDRHLNGFCAEKCTAIQAGWNRDNPLWKLSGNTVLSLTALDHDLQVRHRVTFMASVQYTAVCSDWPSSCGKMPLATTAARITWGQGKPRAAANMATSYTNSWWKHCCSSQNSGHVKWLLSLCTPASLCHRHKNTQLLLMHWCTRWSFNFYQSHTTVLHCCLWIMIHSLHILFLLIQVHHYSYYVFRFWFFMLQCSSCLRLLIWTLNFFLCGLIKVYFTLVV